MPTSKKFGPSDVEAQLKKAAPFTKLDPKKTFQTVLPLPSASHMDHYMVCDANMVAEAVYMEFPNGSAKVQVSFPLTKVLSQQTVSANSEKFLRLNLGSEGGAIMITPTRRLVATFQHTYSDAQKTRIGDDLTEWLGKGKVFSEGAKRVLAGSMSIDTDMTKDPVFQAVLGKPVKLTPEEMDLVNGGYYNKTYGGKDDTNKNSSSGEKAAAKDQKDQAGAKDSKDQAGAKDSKDQAGAKDAKDGAKDQQDKGIGVVDVGSMASAEDIMHAVGSLA